MSGQMLVWETGHHEYQQTPIEHAWHHALCCVLRDGYVLSTSRIGQMGWWGSELIERRGAEVTP